MKMTRRQLKTLIKESFFGPRKLYNFGPIKNVDIEKFNPYLKTKQSQIIQSDRSKELFLRIFDKMVIVLDTSKGQCSRKQASDIAKNIINNPDYRDYLKVRQGYDEKLPTLTLLGYENSKYYTSPQLGHNTSQTYPTVGGLIPLDFEPMEVQVTENFIIVPDIILVHFYCGDKNNLDSLETNSAALRYKSYVNDLSGVKSAISELDYPISALQEFLK